MESVMVSQLPNENMWETRIRDTKKDKHAPNMYIQPASLET